MKKIFSKYFLIILFLYIFFVLITKPNIIVLSINEATNVFLTNIFPTLFPFFIFSSFVINYNILTYFHIFLRPLFKCFFHMDDNVSMVFILSMITGLPGNAKYINELLDNRKISINDANVILSYTFFPNPMFIIGTVGFGLLNSKRIGFIFLCSIYLTNFILAFIQRNKLNYNNDNAIINEEQRFSIVFKDSITNAINSLIIILGSISVFIIIRNIIDLMFSFNSVTNAIINCILEISSGINKISGLNISFKLKTLLVSSALSFPGLSVFSQCMGITSEYNINYKYIFKYKFLGLLINLFLTYNLYIIFWI